jgi:hypothetical protein
VCNRLVKHALPVIVLVLLAPLVAEVMVGDISFSLAGLVAFVVVIPIYGAGSLLVREAVRRRGAGWVSVLLLGAAYGVVEEGLALQSFFNPGIYGGLGHWWGARVLGVTLSYTEIQLINHAVWSVTIPIAMTELLFPDRRGEPYLGRFGLSVTALIFLFGVGLLMLSTHSTIAPGFWAPLPLLGLALVVVIVLAVVALATAPAAPRLGWTAPPPPWAPFLLAAVASFLCLGMIFGPGHLHLAVMRSPLVVLPMLGSALVAAIAAYVVAGWTSSPGWGDLQTLGLVGGALVGHGLAGELITAHRVELTVLLVVMLGLLGLTAVLIRRRERLGVTA